jgi:hypothetical protein
MNETICNAENACRFTGTERLVEFMRINRTDKVRLFRDNFGQYRIVYFSNGQGVSAVLVGKDKTIRFKYTAPSHRGQNMTRQLQAMLTLWSVKWLASDYQTAAGAACYKGA